MGFAGRSTWVLVWCVAGVVAAPGEISVVKDVCLNPSSMKTLSNVLLQLGQEGRPGARVNLDGVLSLSPPDLGLDRLCMAKPAGCNLPCQPMLEYAVARPASFRRLAAIGLAPESMRNVLRYRAQKYNFPELLIVALEDNKGLVRRVAVDEVLVKNLAGGLSGGVTMDVLPDFSRLVAFLFSVRALSLEAADMDILRHFSALPKSQLGEFVTMLMSGKLAPYRTTVAMDNDKLRMLCEPATMAAFQNLDDFMSKAAKCGPLRGNRFSTIFKSPTHVMGRFMSVAEPELTKAYPPSVKLVQQVLCGKDFERIVGLMLLDKYKAMSPVEMMAELAKDRAENIVHKQQANIALINHDIEEKSHVVEGQAAIVRNMTSIAREKVMEAKEAAHEGNVAVISANGALALAKQHEKNAQLAAKKAVAEGTKWALESVPKVKETMQAAVLASDHAQQVAKSIQAKFLADERMDLENAKADGNKQRLLKKLFGLNPKKKVTFPLDQ